MGKTWKTRRYSPSLLEVVRVCIFPRKPGLVKTTISNITVVSMGPRKLFQWPQHNWCQKLACLTSKVHENFAMCLKSRQQRVYSFLQSSHLREKVTFSSCCHPGTSKYSNAQRKISGPHRSGLGRLCCVYAGSSEWTTSVQSRFQWGDDGVIMRHLGDTVVGNLQIFRLIVSPDEILFCYRCVFQHHSQPHKQKGYKTEYLVWEAMFCNVYKTEAKDADRLN